MAPRPRRLSGWPDSIRESSTTRASPSTGARAVVSVRARLLLCRPRPGGRRTPRPGRGGSRRAPGGRRRAAASARPTASAASPPMPASTSSKTRVGGAGREHEAEGEHRPGELAAGGDLRERQRRLAGVGAEQELDLVARPVVADPRPRGGPGRARARARWASTAAASRGAAPRRGVADAPPRRPRGPRRPRPARPRALRGLVGRPRARRGASGSPRREREHVARGRSPCLRTKLAKRLRRPAHLRRAARGPPRSARRVGAARSPRRRARPEAPRRRPARSDERLVAAERRRGEAEDGRAAPPGSEPPSVRAGEAAAAAAGGAAEALDLGQRPPRRRGSSSSAVRRSRRRRSRRARSGAGRARRAELALVPAELRRCGRRARRSRSRAARTGARSTPAKRSSASRWVGAVQERLVGVLAVQVDEAVADVGELARRSAIRPSTNARERPSARDVRRRTTSSPAASSTKRPSTTASSAPRRARCAGVGPAAEQQLERLDDERLAGAGLAGERGHARRRGRGRGRAMTPRSRTRSSAEHAASAIGQRRTSPGARRGSRGLAEASRSGRAPRRPRHDDRVADARAGRRVEPSTDDGGAAPVEQRRAGPTPRARARGSGRRACGARRASARCARSRGETIGPRAERLYAVEPVGVETSRPSAT